MLKNCLSLIAASAGFLLVTSCYVVPDGTPPRPTQAELEARKKEADERVRKEAEDLKKKEAAAKKKREAERLAAGDPEEIKSTGRPKNGADNPDDGTLPKPREPKEAKNTPASYPTAKKIPGQEGYVLSPYNQKKVDVRGIESGRRVYDPTYDRSEKKIFLVP